MKSLTKEERDAETRRDYLMRMWTEYLPERGREGFDRLGPLLVKVYDDRQELTKEDRQLACDLLHDLAWIAYFPASLAAMYKRAIERETLDDPMGYVKPKS